MIVDTAVYSNGKRTGPCSIEEARRACEERSGFAWIGILQPNAEEFESVTREFGLHHLAVEDAVNMHQRPKLERYGDLLFVVLRSARYADESETVEFGEIHVFLGPDFIITVRHNPASRMSEVRERLENDPDLLRKGPPAVLYAIVDRVVDDYEPVIEGLENDIDEIEGQVFDGNAGVSRRIYELSREVIQFRRAVAPLSRVLDLLSQDSLPSPDPEVYRCLRDVHGHALKVGEQIEGFRELLSNILNVNLTLVSVDQNDQTKKISAWAAILIVPTIITGIYGMNFQVMPELSWSFGYPLALGLIVLISGLLYLNFKRSGWL